MATSMTRLTQQGRAKNWSSRGFSLSSSQDCVLKHARINMICRKPADLKMDADVVSHRPISSLLQTDVSSLHSRLQFCLALDQAQLLELADDLAKPKQNEQACYLCISGKVLRVMLDLG